MLGMLDWCHRSGIAGSYDSLIYGAVHVAECVIEGAKSHSHARYRLSNDVFCA